MQGGLTSVGLDKKTKRRRPLPVQPQPMMMEEQNALAQMAGQRPMLGTDPTADLRKKEMMYGK